MNTGPVFCRINKGNHIVSDHISAQAIFDLVRHFGKICGPHIAPHDLRCNRASWFTRQRAN